MLAKKKSYDNVNVLSHELVPDMKIISEEEKIKVLKKYQINGAQMPRIFDDDPAAVALKAKSGDVLQIERDDSTGHYRAYRIVVS